MTKRLIKVKQQTNTMLLTWITNNICNNHCAYCPPILHTGKNHHYEWEKAKEFLYRLFSHYPRIHCSISGGEPTLSPFFKELVEIFYEKASLTWVGGVFSEDFILRFNNAF
jgi:organic radical activating enzyme